MNPRLLPPRRSTFPLVNKGLAKKNFFEYLDFALQFAPPGPDEKDIRAKLARIGIGPGKRFDFKDLSLEHKLEVGLGMKAGEKKVEEKVATIGKDTNGWLIGSAFGDRNFYHGNWLLRAAAAKAGIYGNDAVEATYPLLHNDDKGDKVDCSKQNYTITFPTGQDKESKLATRTKRPDLYGNAIVLAEGDAAFDSARRRGNVETAGSRTREVT